MKVRFLLNENLPPRLKTALLRLNPQIDVTHVGEPSAPPTGTLDPEMFSINKLVQMLSRAGMNVRIEVDKKVARCSVGFFVGDRHLYTIIIEQAIAITADAVVAKGDRLILVVGFNTIS